MLDGPGVSFGYWAGYVAELLSSYNPAMVHGQNRHAHCDSEQGLAFDSGGSACPGDGTDGLWQDIDRLSLGFASIDPRSLGNRADACSVYLASQGLEQ